MSAPYAGNGDNFADTIDVLDDGDEADAISIAPALEALADMAAFLEQRVRGVAKPGTTTTIPVRMAPVNIFGLSNEGGSIADNFVFGSLTGVGAGWIQSDVADAGALVIELSADLPKKCRITSVSLALACDTHAADPVAGGATMPSIAIIEENIAAKTSAVAVGSTVVDAPASKATYEALHYLSHSFGGTPYQWDVANNKRLYLTLTGETGTNTAANKLLFKGLTATIQEEP